MDLVTVIAKTIKEEGFKKKFEKNLDKCIKELKNLDYYELVFKDEFLSIIKMRVVVEYRGLFFENKLKIKKTLSLKEIQHETSRFFRDLYGNDELIIKNLIFQFHEFSSIMNLSIILKQNYKFTEKELKLIENIKRDGYVTVRQVAREVGASGSRNLLNEKMNEHLPILKKYLLEINGNRTERRLYITTLPVDIEVKPVLS